MKKLQKLLKYKDRYSKINYYPTIYISIHLGGRAASNFFFFCRIAEIACSPSATLPPATLPLDLLGMQSCPDTISGEQQG